MEKTNVRNAARHCPSGCWPGFCPACLMKQGAAAGYRRAAGNRAVSAAGSRGNPPDCFRNSKSSALIGKGGMGAVYRARQPALDRIVALKILPPQTATGPNFVRAFQPRGPRARQS